MNQFTQLFLENPNYIDERFKHLKRAVNSQKCVRISGKHNDFDDVGKDSYHHTFFEMLGNWSFGDYSKKEACHMAWDLLTKHFKISPERLYVTYFGGDPTHGLEADLNCREMWLEMGVPSKQVLPFGMKDNFWEMGESGPCGPCTEIHYSHLPLNQSAAGLVNSGGASVIEIWNLVFIQYCRDAKGGLKKLQRQYVDTGMGLERLTAVLNGKLSNYDTDLFLPIFSQIQKITGCSPYSGKFGLEDVNQIDTAYRIISDHIRMATVCIADGLIPHDIGAGHCLRRAIRRATVKSLTNLNYKNPLMSQLVPTVSDILGPTYSNIPSNLNQIIKVISEEEEKFLSIISKGIQLFNEFASRCNVKNEFSAEFMWELYFVHGISEELILELVESKGLIPQLQPFRQLVAKEKLKSQEAYRHHLKVKAKEQIDINSLVDAKIPPTVDIYKYTVELDSENQMVLPDVKSNIVALWNGTEFVKEISSSDDTIAIITKETNFYSESGGQKADIGYIANEKAKFEVENVINFAGYVAHYGKLLTGKLSEDVSVCLSVDFSKRSGCMRSHTATHLLNSLLREIIGKTDQHSSIVDKDHLKFTFKADNALPEEKLVHIESKMKKLISEKIPVIRKKISFSEAKQIPGFVTVPGEVYPSNVAVIDISMNGEIISLEPCCGTHLMNTEDIIDFVITAHKSEGQRVRSVTAAVGPKALQSRATSLQAEETVKSFASIIDSEMKLNVDLFSLHQQLSNIRTKMTELSVVNRKHLEGNIEELQKKITHLTRMKTKAELMRMIPKFDAERAVVHMFETSGPDQVILSEAIKLYHNKPCFWFVKCGPNLQCRCLVPQENLSTEFNAEIWASLLINEWPILKVQTNAPTRDYKVTVNSGESDFNKIIESVRVYTSKILK
ncbi:hypothetical protein CHUAL_010626 [Chamberlinius hualienensis]